MTNKIRISVSQVKTYQKSPAEWAGQKILKIYKDIVSASMTSGSAFHKVRETGRVEDGYTIISEADPIIKEEAIEKFDHLEANYARLCDLMYVPQSIKNEEVFLKDVFDNGIDWKGFIDGQTEDAVIEYKSSSKLSDKFDKPSMFSAQSNYDDYKFQCWVYMKVTGKKKAYIVEVLSKDTTIKKPGSLKKQDIIDLCEGITEEDKKLTIPLIIEKYKPRRTPGQVITFTMTPTFDEFMEKKYFPILEEMKQLFDKHVK